MWYQLSWRNGQDSERVFLSKSFAGCKRYALAMFKDRGYALVGYHLSEVYNAPLSAVFHVQTDIAGFAIYTITEA